MFNFVDKMIDEYREKKLSEISVVIDEQIETAQEEIRLELEVTQANAEAIMEKSLDDVRALAAKRVKDVQGKGIVRKIIEKAVTKNWGDLAPRLLNADSDVRQSYKLIRYASFTNDCVSRHFSDTEENRSRGGERARQLSLTKALEFGKKNGIEIIQTLESSMECLKVETYRRSSSTRFDITMMCTLNVAFYSMNEEIESKLIRQDMIKKGNAMQLEADIESGDSPTIDTIDMISIDPDDAIVDQEVQSVPLVSIDLPTTTGDENE